MGGSTLFLEDDARLLPCTVSPREDELLSSWLVRLSHQHALKVQTFTKLLFPGIQIWNRDIDKFAPDRLLSILSQKTLASLDRIKNTSLRSYEGKLYLSHNHNGNTRWILPLGIYHRTHQSYGLLFCPKCLEKDGTTPYFRKKWRLSFSVICPDCKVYLHDKCPCCAEPVVFFRIELGKRDKLPGKAMSSCHKCGFDLSESRSKAAPRRLVYQQRKLYRILNEGWKKEVFYPHLYFDVLHQILNILAGTSSRSEKLRKDLLSRFKKGQLLENVPVGHVGFDKLPLENRICYLKQAIWLLEKDQQNLIFLGSYHNLTSAVFLKDMNQVPFWFNELIVDNFFVSNVNRRFEKKHFRKEEQNLEIAPVNGLRGPDRKYSKEHSCIVCGSDWVIKDGNKRGKKMLRCRNCNKRFTN